MVGQCCTCSPHDWLAIAPVHIHCPGHSACNSRGTLQLVVAGCAERGCTWQAVTFLVIHQKHKKSLEEITNDLCPVLSVQQLYRISTMYWDDRYNTETVSHEVLGRMKQLMVDNNTAASHSFLLDDDSSIPFSLDDIAALMEDKVWYTHLRDPWPPVSSEPRLRRSCSQPQVIAPWSPF